MKRYKKYIMIFVIVLLLPITAIISFRVYKDINKKLKYENTYAIQSVKTGKNIRVYDARIEDGVDIILYSNYNWECMTWQMIQLQDSSYLLKNLYTEKSVQPEIEPKDGAKLIQKTLGSNKWQQWEFIKKIDGTYLIKLKGTELFITITNDQDNSNIVLHPKQDGNNQMWKLVRQNPWI